MSILVPEDNGKQNPDESYMNRYQTHVAAVMVIKYYAWMINSVSLLIHS